MRHVQRNQVLHPENRQPMVLAHSNDDNRDNALRDIPTVSDEKGVPFILLALTLVLIVNTQGKWSVELSKD